MRQALEDLDRELRQIDSYFAESAIDNLKSIVSRIIELVDRALPMEVEDD